MPDSKISEYSGEPWERQPGESAKAYEGFCTFRDLGEKRTTPATARAIGKNEALIKRWRSQYNWNARALAFDNSVQRAAYAKVVKDKASMTSRHIRTAMQVQQKALEALQELKVEDMTPRDVKEYIRIGTELERMSRAASMADAVENIKKTESGENTVQEMSIKQIRQRMDAMTDEQLAAYEELCAFLSPED